MTRVRLCLKNIVVLFSTCRVILICGGPSEKPALRQLDCSICDREFEMVTIFRHEDLFGTESPSTDFGRVQIVQPLDVRDHDLSFPDTPAYNTYPKKIPSKTFSPNWWSLDLSLTEIE